jgi:hypothetical protein
MDNGAIWYVLTITIFFLISILRYKDRIIGWFLSAVAIGFLYLPWLPFFLIQTRQVTEDFWLTPPSFQTVLELSGFPSYNFPFVELSLIYMTMILCGLTLFREKHGSSVSSHYGCLSR